MGNCLAWDILCSDPRAISRNFSGRPCAVVAPGRNFAVVCFERVTSFSTYLAEPGRNALGQTEPFAKNALGKPGRNAAAEHKIDGLVLARRLHSRVSAGRVPSGFRESTGGKFESWGGQSAGIAFC